MTDNKAVKVLVGVGLVVLVVALAASGYGGWRVYKGLKWVKEQNARADELPTLEELIGPPIPDEQNAALVYQRAFDAFELSDEDKEVLYGEPDAKRPGLRVYNLPKVEAVVVKNERALALLDKAAAMADCSFPVDWSDPINADLSHFACMRQAVQLHRGKAQVLAPRGELAAALDSIAVCLEFGKDTKKGAPCLLSFLSQAGMDVMALRAVEQIIDERDCPAEASARLRARLRRTDMRASLTPALKGSAAALLFTFEHMPELVLGGLAEEGDTSTRGMERGLWVLSSLKGVNRAYFAKLMSDCIELAPLPYRESHQNWAELEAQAARIPRYAILCHMMVPLVSDGRLVAKRDAGCASVELCGVALDLKAHKHEHGQYPQALDELPEACEEGYAEDIFSGERLKYRREGEGFLLYSFGTDLDDDDGLPFGREVNGKPERDNGDLVWQCSK